MTGAEIVLHAHAIKRIAKAIRQELRPQNGSRIAILKHVLEQTRDDASERETVQSWLTRIQESAVYKAMKETSPESVALLAQLIEVILANFSPGISRGAAIDLATSVLVAEPG